MASKAQEYKVIKTFDSPQGLKRKGTKVTFKSKKDEALHVGMGYVEPIVEFKPKKRKPVEDEKEKGVKPQSKRKTTSNKPPVKKKG